ncbi:MAG: hypothetical protein NTZ01_04145 [Verrucomicrobia bacterium]|nr:hypothetical protein [Verrucomicrobiota bacterium]
MKFMQITIVISALLLGGSCLLRSADCADNCGTDKSYCSVKTSKCASVPLERGGKKASAYGDKGCPRRY